MSRAKVGKCLLEWMQQQRLTEYGSVILGTEVRKVLDLEIPAIASKATFDGLALRELAAVDYVRNVLLGQGKYLEQHCGDYRILLPSENRRQVEQYLAQSKNKLQRAMKLLRNSPKTDIYDAASDPSGRLLMAQESLKDAQRKILD